MERLQSIHEKREKQVELAPYTEGLGRRETGRGSAIESGGIVIVE
jgi:hypothetical protein